MTRYGQRGWDPVATWTSETCICAAHHVLGRYIPMSRSAMLDAVRVRVYDTQADFSAAYAKSLVQTSIIPDVERIPGLDYDRLAEEAARHYVDYFARHGQIDLRAKEEFAVRLIEIADEIRLDVTNADQLSQVDRVLRAVAYLSMSNGQTHAGVVHVPEAQATGKVMLHECLHALSHQGLCNGLDEGITEWLTHEIIRETTGETISRAYPELVEVIRLLVDAGCKPELMSLYFCRDSASIHAKLGSRTWYALRRAENRGDYNAAKAIARGAMDGTWLRDASIPKVYKTMTQSSWKTYDDGAAQDLQKRPVSRRDAQQRDEPHHVGEYTED